MLCVVDFGCGGMRGCDGMPWAGLVWCGGLGWAVFRGSGASDLYTFALGWAGWAGWAGLGWALGVVGFWPESVCPGGWWGGGLGWAGLGVGGRGMLAGIRMPWGLLGWWAGLGWAVIVGAWGVVLFS